MFDSARQVLTPVYCYKCDRWFDLEIDNGRKRPKEIACEDCGSPIRVPARGFLPRIWQRVMRRLNSA
jgi:DNA-directed RNA polymerase subunit RPC12/RpoP